MTTETRIQDREALIEAGTARLPDGLLRLWQAGVRVALSAHVTNGLTSAAGLLVIWTLVHQTLGPAAAATVTIGVVSATPPDQPAPRRGKFTSFLPALLLGTVMFLGVQALRHSASALFLVLAAATFIAFLAPAWGRRGLALTASLVFATLLPLAGPEPSGFRDVLGDTLLFFTGAGLYVAWATAANALVNPRYRKLAVADALSGLADLMRAQGLRLTLPAGVQERVALTTRLMKLQASLAESFQSARNLVLEAPGERSKLRCAGLLLQALEIQDHLIACGLDVDAIRQGAHEQDVLAVLGGEIQALASDLERLADALRQGRVPAPFSWRRPPLAQAPAATVLPPPSDLLSPTPRELAQALARRIGHLHQDVAELYRVAAGAQEPPAPVLRGGWRLFVAAPAWSWRPALPIWRRDSAVLRHAVRATLAIAVGHAIALALPWQAHEPWILMSIAFVLRGNLSQTLQRRDSRLGGTLIGCVLAGALLYSQLPPAALVLVLALAYGTAHAFVLHQYWATALAGTVLALVQSHLLGAGGSPGLDLVERLLDTSIGVGLAWLASYVLPSWERAQVDGLVRRALAAQARHARSALGGHTLCPGDTRAERAWRLARREAYDSLAALVQAIERSVAEPAAVRLPLDALGRIVARSYELLAHLAAIRTMLVRSGDPLPADRLEGALREASRTIERALALAGSHPGEAVPARAGAAQLLADEGGHALVPWMLRQLRLASDTARDLHAVALTTTARA